MQKWDFSNKNVNILVEHKSKLREVTIYFPLKES